jgi:hypothetical protein
MSKQDSDSLAEARNTVRVREAAFVARAGRLEKKRAPLLTRVRGVAAVVLACVSLAGCASSTDVVASARPGTYTVAASATV